MEAQLPVGTQVVLRTGRRKGATGRVAALDGAGYLIRLADGAEIAAERAALSLRRSHQAELALPPGGDPHALVRDHTIFSAIVGSRAFGLATDGSDTDLRGVYAAPTELFWSLVKPPSHVEGPAHEQFSWEVERFCELALKANPNLLELLWSPLVQTMTPLGEELLALRPAFLSQLVAQTYSGYVLSQFKKIEADMRRTGAPKWKHVMHLLRLLRAGSDLLRTGDVVVDAGPDRERLLAVRRGEVPWPDVDRWRLQLHADFDDALTRTALPAAPDVAAVDGWLRDLRAASAAATLSGDSVP